MKKVDFLPFRNSRNNTSKSPLGQRAIPNINLLIFKALYGARNLLKHLLQTKQGARFAAHLNRARIKFEAAGRSERGDVPGWVLVVLMTTGLVTGIWTVAQPRLSSILKNSLDNMNSIR